MSEPPSAQSRPGAEDRLSALFAQLIMQQANMAMMLMGKVEHPDGGQAVKDIEAARFFIDELEMLEVKTRGNLTKEEAALLQQSLMSLRMAFVEAVESHEPAAAKAPDSAAPGKASAPASESAATGPSNAEEEHRKKFTKKY
ncbi:MAG TPA: DUF1844 domain-containing protein [Verrucomicrobiae bacterium]|nr:DUF1844 domain-containing protein [Verrucomicrobiae bacterium]